MDEDEPWSFGHVDVTMTHLGGSFDFEVLGLDHPDADSGTEPDWSFVADYDLDLHSVWNRAYRRKALTWHWRALRTGCSTVGTVQDPLQGSG